jgi:hypothetical protein
MNSLTSCRYCSHQIHESAVACPQCGAPTKAPATANGKAVYTSYDQVPWHRKRWFAIVMAFVFMPVLVVLAFTGDIYFPKNGEVKTFPKWYKFAILGLFIAMVAGQVIGNTDQVTNVSQNTSSGPEQHALQQQEGQGEACYYTKLWEYQNGMGEDAPVSNDVMNEWRSECGLKPV